MGRLRRIVRLYHTVKYLKSKQILFRFWSRAYRPPVDRYPHPARRIVQGTWIVPVIKPPHLIRAWEFTFLGVTRDCRFPADWNNPTIEKLWLYNLHYFDVLHHMDAASRQQLHAELLLKWIAENPPGTGNGWEPYPTSLRIVNWVKWALANDCSEPVIQSLAVQIRYLLKRLEYHLLGNHLFANGKALVFGGLFFTGAEAEKWLARGLGIIERQLAEQVLADGGHFERSPMYHEIILEDLLDLMNIMSAYGAPVPDSWRDRARRMLSWLMAMCHPDGDIALLNDAAFGVAARPEALRVYADKLGIEGGSQPLTSLIHLAESGYVRWQNEDACVILDVGDIGPDYLPGHAHADTLSFEMSLLGRRFIVDSGTSCYGLSEERLRQRATLAHNTVSIDGIDSSEVWSGFRVARRARPFDLEIGKSGAPVTISCSHDGFCRKRKGLIHRRTWELGSKSLRIRDKVGGGTKHAVAFFHFHPEVELEWDEQKQCVSAALSGAQIATLHFSGGDQRIIETTYHPEFGMSVANKCLEISMNSEQCETFISW